jgi:hypothetical protein
MQAGWIQHDHERRVHGNLGVGSCVLRLFWKVKGNNENLQSGYLLTESRFSRALPKYPAISHG